MFTALMALYGTAIVATLGFETYVYFCGNPFQK